MMKKKLLCILLSAAMVLTAMDFPALASEAQTEDTVESILEQEAASAASSENQAETPETEAVAGDGAAAPTQPESETASPEETSDTELTDAETEESTHIQTEEPTGIETEESTENETATELETETEETTAPESEETAPAGTALQAAYHTVDEIREFLKQEKADKADRVTYAAAPATEAPYSAGALSDATLASATALVRQIRFIAGLPYEIDCNDTYSQLSQSAALVSYINHDLSHTPSQPSDMSDELFRQGCEGISNSSTAYAGRQAQTLNETIIDTWMADCDSDDSPALHNRRRILTPSVKQVGFGAVKGSNGIYSAMYTADHADGTEPVFGIAWPAQNMPVEYFDSTYPWSVSTGEQLNASEIRVTLTRKSDNKKWTFSTDSSDGDFYVDNDSSTQKGCIIFRPDSPAIAAYEDGDSFAIAVTKNKIPYLDYTVQFFSVSGEEEKLSVPTANIAAGESVAKETPLILTSAEDAAIYYTLDSTVPTAESILYTEPISIATDLTVRAVAIKDGYADSDIATYAYTVAEDAPLRYTVTFVSGDDAVTIPAQSVLENETVELPEHPAKDGYLLDGWYKEASFENKWDFERDTVLQDIALFAKWTEITPETLETPETTEMPETSETIETLDTYTVTFDMQGIGATPESVTITSGELLPAPDEPTAEGYVFVQWYREADCINTWNFETDIITEDTVLYAKWMQIDAAANPIADNSVKADSNPIDLSAASSNVQIGNIKPKVYDGKPYQPAIKITAYNGIRQVTLKKDKDYTLSYKNNVNAGENTATVTITGKGSYKGSVERNFTITPKNIKKLKIITESKRITDKTAKIFVYDGTALLNNRLFTFEYIEPENPKKAKVTLTAAENTNYTGSVTVRLTVYDDTKEQLINPARFTMTGDTVYTGKAITREITGKLGETELIPNKDYKVQYQNNTNAGTAFAIITGKGKFKGKVVLTFNIAKANMADDQYITINPIAAKTFNGKEQKPAVTVKAKSKKLKLNTDYSVAYVNNLHSGTATIQINGIGTNCTGNRNVTFEINPQDIKKASVKVTKATDKVPSMIVLTYSKKTLQEYCDYEITNYEEAKGKKVKVTIKGIADFKGQVVKSLKTEIPPAEPEASPAKSNNVNRHNYLNFKSYGLEVASNLFQNADGTLTRVEYVGGKGVYIECYTADEEHKFLSQTLIKAELPMFGGFYATKDNYFLVFGQKNFEHDDNKEVIRFVKYDKDWNRQQDARLYGINTHEPFIFSSVRMADHEGVLYVRTGHNMYNGHQANMAFSINMEDMKFINQFYTLGGPSIASHSLNQYITLDEPYLITADHGDAYPRGVLLAVHFKAGEKNTYFTSKNAAKTITALEMGGKIGSNITGVSVGGLEATSTSYLVVGNSVDQTPETYNPSGMLNIFVSSTPKDNFSNEAVKVHWITDYKYIEYTDASGIVQKVPEAVVHTPQLVKINSSETMLLWTEERVVIEDDKPVIENNKIKKSTILKSVLLNADGEPASGIYTYAEGRLSDCKPILMNDSLVWYYTNNSTPIFCSLNIDAVRKQPR